MPETQIDILWVLICSFLVFLMQPGFACLEAGMVRQKNAASVAAKNLTDICIVCLVYAFFGFGVMFGDSFGSVVGIPTFTNFQQNSAGYQAFFLFELMFCGTAVTIISGAVAERIRFIGYCCVAALTAAFIYPVVGHWVWATTTNGEPAGWLKQIGFVDFAGSTVVHSVGGWVALAAVITVGPRIGINRAADQSMERSNYPLAALGLFLLWIGWFGFNAGSSLAFSSNSLQIITGTVLAGAAGGFSCLTVFLFLHKQIRIRQIINGVLAGLVAFSAGSNIISPAAACIIGASGGVICLLGTRALQRLGIDDTVGAIPVHLFGGIWGTLAIPIFAPDDSWSTGLSRLEQLGVQLLGTSVVGLFAFTLSFIVFKSLHRGGYLRLSAAEEITGVDISEHGVQDSLLDLAMQIDQQTSNRDFSQPVSFDPMSDASRLGHLYNSALGVLGHERRQQKELQSELERKANFDALTGLANRNLMTISIERALRLAHRHKNSGAVFFVDLDGFKIINDTLGHSAGDRSLVQVSQRIKNCLRESDLVGRLGGDEFCVLIENLSSVGDAARVARKLLDALSEPIDIGSQKVKVGASIGIAEFTQSHKDTAHSILQKADEAMYEVKAAGKSNFQLFEPSEDVQPENDHSIQI